MDAKVNNAAPPVVNKTQNNDSTSYLPLLIGIFIVLLTIAVFLIFVKKRVKRNAVLFVGLSDSGKTLLFARLAYSKYVDTHTSMTQNVAEYATGKARLLIVDVPGQERVRNRIFEQLKSSALGIVFVVDASTIQQELRDVAEYLYSILVDDAVQANRPRLLVLCNKQDQPMVKGAPAIKNLLEKELNIVRKTKSSQLDSIDNKSAGVFLGSEDKPLQFDDLDLDVSFAESSAILADEDTGPELDNLSDWLEGLN